MIPIRRLCFAVALLLWGWVSPAQAQVQMKAGKAGQIAELSHTLNIQAGTRVVDVVEKITLANTKRGQALALIEFDMPARAAIYGLEIDTFDGHKTVSAAVGLAASSTLLSGTAPKALPDKGLLRMISTEGDGPEDLSRYELRVYPVSSVRNTEITLRWQMPARLVDGRYSLSLPDRGDASVLARSEVIVSAARGLHGWYNNGTDLGPGTALGKSRRYRFFAPAGPLHLSAQLAPAPRAYAEVALLPLSKTTGIAALRIVLPEATKRPMPGFDRALVIVDASKSMGTKGKAAAGKFVDSILTQLGSNMPVEVITYARRSKRVFGAWKPAQRQNRVRISKAIAASALENGSRLDRALAAASKALGSSVQQKKRTLLVIVTDSMLPATLKYRDLEVALGHSNMAHTTILATVLTDPKAPKPDLRDSPLEQLALAGSGRVASVYTDQSASRGQALLDELQQRAPLQALEVKFDTGVFVGAQLHGDLRAGQSMAAFGFYKNGVPKRAWVSGLQSGKRVSIAALTLHGAEETGLVRIVLSTTSADGFVGRQGAAELRRRFRESAATLSVVSQVSALVAVDSKDGFALDRLALAKKWGGQFYRRMPSSAEDSASVVNAFRYKSRRERVRKKGWEGRQTGELDAKLVQRLVRAHVIPVVRNCYESKLGRQPTLSGQVTVHFEVARGEVQDVRLEHMSDSLSSIRSCIVDAVYAIPFPRVFQGARAEKMYVAKYPLRFRRAQRGNAKVEAGTDKKDPNPETNDPLWGLPE